MILKISHFLSEMVDRFMVERRICQFHGSALCGQFTSRVWYHDQVSYQWNHLRSKVGRPTKQVSRRIDFIFPHDDDHYCLSLGLGRTFTGPIKRYWKLFMRVNLFTWFKLSFSHFLSGLFEIDLKWTCSEV